MQKLNRSGMPSLRSLLLLLIMLGVTGAANAAAPGEAAGNLATGTGKKKLLLFAKDPANWQIVRGGASGKLIYRESRGRFTLSAKGLKPRAAYALVRIEETPPGGQVLARGISDGQGRIELGGIWRDWTRKFWLVAGEDVSGAVGGPAALRAWHPSRYLFEEKPLGVPCDCPEPEEP
ncbi:hypothetical protein GMST_36610 [Geomonas silvestris]|uniref:Uncharacterized protein n=1 Tax=Geomonas silvestris TaxID=2740184 RepID=A0A6V8MMT7_9BACT|nr:hypothetical protein [Geomonas silvestris]GFO61336.1 hypothetical protein GMST_36610 [Geomonas silvestris]